MNATGSPPVSNQPRSSKTCGEVLTCLSSLLSGQVQNIVCGTLDIPQQLQIQRRGSPVWQFLFPSLQFFVQLHTRLFFFSPGSGLPALLGMRPPCCPAERRTGASLRGPCLGPDLTRNRRVCGQHRDGPSGDNHAKGAAPSALRSCHHQAVGGRKLLLENWCWGFFFANVFTVDSLHLYICGSLRLIKLDEFYRLFQLLFMHLQRINKLHMTMIWFKESH